MPTLSSRLAASASRGRRRRNGTWRGIIRGTPPLGGHEDRWFGRMFDKLRSMFGSDGAAGAEDVHVAADDDACEECGSTPADSLVGVRWFCAKCAPAARQAEAEEQAAFEARQAGERR